jgi:hypothetical protein
MACCRLWVGVRVALLPKGVRVRVPTVGMRVSLALAVPWLPPVMRAPALPLPMRAALAIAVLALATALLALATALLALATALLALALAGARLPVGMPVRVPARTVRLGARRVLRGGCERRRYRRLPARRAGLRCWRRAGRADDIVGELLDRRREHTRERGGRGPAQEDGSRRSTRRGLRAEPRGPPGGAAGTVPRYWRAGPAPELGQGAGLAGQFPGARFGAQRAQDIRHRQQPGRDIPFPGKQRRQVGVGHGGPVLERRWRDV